MFLPIVAQTTSTGVLMLIGSPVEIVNGLYLYLKLDFNIEMFANLC